ncbi:MAG: alpha/beta fold hydrolase, partial [Spirochaetales bacterium]|nr:alpha/beta fold hydrolase [Spirochaetales bacterium]
MIGVSNEKTDIIEARPFTFSGEGGDVIHALKWLPPKDSIRALLVINHGMAEHIARYHDFAEYLAEKGFAVYGEDHRGHGKTAGKEGTLGFFHAEKGWMKVLSDIRTLHLLAADENKDVPVFMLGHSMGSFLTRHYLSLYGSELKGAVISGTGSHPAGLLAAASVIAKIESALKGKTHPSKLLDTMSFGAYNKPFKSDSATGFEWLSRDNSQVRKYVEDPYCGFISTSSMYEDLFEGLKIINRASCFRGTSSKLPILIYSGTADPVGGPKAKGVKLVYESYKRAGVEDLTM